MITLDKKYFEDVCQILKSHGNSADFLRFGLAWSESQIQNALDRDIAYGLLENQKLVSFVLGRKINNEVFEIDMTMTNAGALKSGFMQKLFHEMVTSLKEQFFQEIWLEVHEENAPAIYFYKKMGFIENSKRPKYYPDGKGALLMTYSFKSN